MELSFSFERFPELRDIKLGMKMVVAMWFLQSLKEKKFCSEFFPLFVNYKCKMQERRVSTLSTEVLRKETSPSRGLVFISSEQESGLIAGIGDLCVWGACNTDLRQAMKARDKGEPYQLKWV